MQVFSSRDVHLDDLELSSGLEELLDDEQAVVLRATLGASWCTGLDDTKRKENQSEYMIVAPMKISLRFAISKCTNLDESGVDGDGEITDQRVDRLTRAVRDNHLQTDIQDG